MAVGALFVVCGLLFVYLAGKRPWRTEEWLIENTPKQFGSYEMVPGKDGDGITYKMTQATYDELGPYGIAARVMRNPMTGEQYDAVVIMSSRKDSFHDPRVCFTAQDWLLADEKVITVKTSAHGPIQVTLATMINSKNGGAGKQLAAFFYRGPEGFAATTNGLKWQMFKHQFTKMSNAEGVFYRVIPLLPGTKQEDLERFIDEFLAATDKASGGLL